MSRKLELIREKKLHKLFPGKKQKKLEASGVYVADESTCYVIFDNLNKVGRVDLKLKSSKSNKLIYLLNVGTGFEDITYDPLSDRFYLIVEALEDKSHGGFRGLVSEYDGDFMFHRCSQLEPAFKNKNKGFEGVEHIRRGDTEYLVGLWEDTLGQDGNKGRGRLYTCSPKPATAHGPSPAPSICRPAQNSKTSPPSPAAETVSPWFHKSRNDYGWERLMKRSVGLSKGQAPPIDFPKSATATSKGYRGYAMTAS
ncbi:hypothetical protein Mal52_15230 [Symmachiella dynata]|uniref:Uncharacterized protein n=1 Tax=Symmachiella dynata TaxID=2527995 RepID=A0A517ZKN5_9PLAN|nr:hypothetical protein [Symmachiella dynata]QDU43052.1 hypothetical protein Mal52_15230 [Symmachiella dynata]